MKQDTFFAEYLKKDSQFAVLDLGSMKLLGNPHNRGMFKSALSSLDWENAKRDFFFARANEMQCTIFIDIGSNYGLYAIDAVKRGQFEEIHAFEPDRENLFFLDANLRANNCIDKVCVYADAASNANGLATFMNYGDTGHRHLACQEGAQNLVVVTTRKIDSLFSCKDKTIAIKIDTEGSELSVLHGMEELLKNNFCLLQVESWDASEVTPFLQKCGYEEFEQIEPEPDHYYCKKNTLTENSTEAIVNIVRKKTELLNGRIRNIVQQTNIFQKNIQHSIAALSDASVSNCENLKNETEKKISDIRESIEAIKLQATEALSKHDLLAKETVQEIDRLFVKNDKNVQELDRHSNVINLLQIEAKAIAKKQNDENTILQSHSQSVRKLEIYLRLQL